MTTQDQATARADAIARVAFYQWDSIGILIENTFAAQWLAYTLPCQRFADALAAACA